MEWGANCGQGRAIATIRTLGQGIQHRWEWQPTDELDVSLGSIISM